MHATLPPPPTLDIAAALAGRSHVAQGVRETGAGMYRESGLSDGALRSGVDSGRSDECHTDGNVSLSFSSSFSRGRMSSTIRKKKNCEMTSSELLPCPKCPQQFTRRSNLNKHLRSIHDRERRFQCMLCSRRFKRRDHLVKHVRSVHEKERKFGCDICGVRFAEKYNRDKHRESIHLTRRILQCRCGAYFKDFERMEKCLRCKSINATESKCEQLDLL